jgi:hypothetical protein
VPSERPAQIASVTSEVKDEKRSKRELADRARSTVLQDRASRDVQELGRIKNQFMERLEMVARDAAGACSSSSVFETTNAPQHEYNECLIYCAHSCCGVFVVMHLCIGNPLEKLKCLCSLAFIVLIREILWIAARLDSHLEKAEMVELRDESPFTSDRCCCCSLLSPLLSRISIHFLCLLFTPVISFMYGEY